MNIKTLSVSDVIEIHETILRTTYGLPGICPNKSLEAALQRIDNYIFYKGMKDLFQIAALLAIAIAQGHIFNDGNKRTALISTFIFLSLNGYRFQTPEHEAADMMVNIAEKKITRKKFSEWLREHSEEI